jgi:hypothetical protein
MINLKNKDRIRAQNLLKKRTRLELIASLAKTLRVLAVALITQALSASSKRF